MLNRLLITLITLAFANTAHAGPWLREKGTTFSASSVTTTYYLDTSSQAYLEYGLTDKTTVVGDLSIIKPRYAPESGYATVSLRRALSKPDAASKLAYEIGVGVGWIGDYTLPHLRTGLSWGRAIKWGEKNGWAVVEASAIWDLTYAQHIAKIDMTLGMNFTEVTKGMFQIYAAEIAGQSIATIAPSLVFTPRERKFSIQVGAESQIGEFQNSALKLGLWREF